MNITRIIPFALIILFITGCKGCSDKSESKETTDSTANVVPDTTTSGAPDTQASAEPPKRAEPTAPKESVEIKKPSRDPNILSNIDKHLVSSSNIPAGANGISNAIITVKNTLSGVSFQKILVEVTMLEADNRPIQSDYYNVVNLEPGESKDFPIPNNSKASKVIIHVVKVKSNELTNGEFVVTGVHFNQ